MKILESIKKVYNKLSFSGQILILIVILLFLIMFFRNIKERVNQKREALTNRKDTNIVVSEKVTYKEGVDVYDDFYSDIYDYLVFNIVNSKNILLIFFLRKSNSFFIYTPSSLMSKDLAIEFNSKFDSIYILCLFLLDFTLIKSHWDNWDKFFS
jgi:hypothetical protein